MIKCEKENCDGEMKWQTKYPFGTIMTVLVCQKCGFDRLPTIEERADNPDERREWTGKP